MTAERERAAGRGGAPPEAGWGPDVERRGTSRRGVRLLGSLLVVVLLLAIATPLLVSSRIPREPVPELASGGSPTHVLVAGSDSREDLSADEQRELTTGSANEFTGERTDTVFVMTFDGGDVALLSFPRDLWVTRCDGSTGRINVAQSIDGPGCLVRTVRDLSGIEVSHYLGITFGGFRDVVDAVGGVDLCLEDPIADQDAGIDLPAGCQTLDGTDALGYVRVRKIDDDLQRIQRQQTFMRALAGELSEPSTLFNPVRLWNLSGEAGDAVTVDDGLGVLGLGRLGLAMRGLAGGDVATYTVPADPGRTDGGADVLYVRESEAEPLFARFRDGSVLQEVDQELEASDVRVSVLNGAGVDGLAGRVGELLEGRGYDVADVGNTDVRESSVVRYPPGQREGAERLRTDLPAGATLEETTDVSVVTIFLGRDATGAL